MSFTCPDIPGVAHVVLIRPICRFNSYLSPCRKMKLWETMRRIPSIVTDKCSMALRFISGGGKYVYMYHPAVWHHPKAVCGLQLIICNCVVREHGVFLITRMEARPHVRFRALFPWTSVYARRYWRRRPLIDFFGLMYRIIGAKS